MLIIDNMLMANVSMSVIVRVDFWSHALSISCYKMLMSCIGKENVSLFCEIRKLLPMAEEVLRYQLHIPIIDIIHSSQGLPSLTVWQPEASDNFHVQAR